MHKTFLAVAAAVAILVPSGSQAGDLYWVGGPSGSWNGNNWASSPGGQVQGWTESSNAVFDNAGTVVVTVDSPDTRVGTITFSGAGAVTVAGAKSLTVVQVVNTSPNVNVFSNAVDFTSTVNLTGSTQDVAFWGGATGTLPVGFTNFVGRFTLGGTKWTLTGPIHLAENSTIAGANLTIETGGPGRLTAEAGSRLDVKVLAHTGEHLTAAEENDKKWIYGGDMFGDHFHGDIKAKSFLLDHAFLMSLTNNFTGVMKIGYSLLYDWSRHVEGGGADWQEGSIKYATPFGFSGKLVVTGDGDTHELVCNSGAFQFQNPSPETPFYLGCTCNYKLTKKRPGTDRENGFDIVGGSTLRIDTTDFDDHVTAREVTAVVPADRWGASLITGDGLLEVVGRGTMFLKDECQYRGGTVVRDTATLKMEGGAHPGRGNVELRDQARLYFNSPANGSVNIGGSLALSSGSRLVFNNLEPGKLAVSVGGAMSAASVSNIIEITGTSLARGTYCLVAASAISLPEGQSFSSASFVGQVPLANPGDKVSLVRFNGVLLLQVGEDADITQGLGIWTGSANNGRLLDGGNWYGGEKGIPQQDGVLQLYSIGTETHIYADSAYGDGRLFSTVKLGAGRVILHGKLHVTALTNAFNLAVASDGQLTVDNEIVIDKDSGSGYFLESNEGVVNVKGRALGRCANSTSYFYQYGRVTEDTKPMKVGSVIYFCVPRDYGWYAPEDTRGALYMYLTSVADQPGDWVIGQDRTEPLAPYPVVPNLSSRPKGGPSIDFNGLDFYPYLWEQEYLTEVENRTGGDKYYEYCEPSGSGSSMKVKVLKKGRDADWSSFCFANAKTTLRCGADWTLEMNGVHPSAPCDIRPRGNGGQLVFDTTKYGTENVGCTVWLNGCITDYGIAVDRAEPPYVIKGCGKVVFMLNAKLTKYDSGSKGRRGVQGRIRVESGATARLERGVCIGEPMSASAKCAFELADGGIVEYPIGTNRTQVATIAYNDKLNLILPSEGCGVVSLDGEGVRLDIGRYSLLHSVPEGWNGHNLRIEGSAVRGRAVSLVENQLSHGLDMVVKDAPFDIILR